MTQITVGADIARQIEGASLPIFFVDENGKPLVKATENAMPPGMTAEYWAELQRRLKTPGKYSTLEEIKKRHGWQDPK
jgi:hypothetical protein